MKYSAQFSRCRRYRWTLTREWDSTRGTCVFIGLNPSTANQFRDDPTIRRCINYSMQWGFGKLIMVNLFAFRATNPSTMKADNHPVGKYNIKYINSACRQADLIIAAWGNHGFYNKQSETICRYLHDRPVKCFEITKRGQPVHPLYQRNDAKLIAFTSSE